MYNKQRNVLKFIKINSAFAIVMFLVFYLYKTKLYKLQ